MKSWTTSISVTIVALLLLAATGCGGMSKPAVSKRYYDIGPIRTAEAQAPSSEVLTVRRLRVSPMNAGREMVYKTSDTGFSSDFYHAYFIPPADMLSQALRRWLHASGLYEHVVETASLVRGDLVLEGNVVALYGDFTAGGQAVAEMQFFLLDEGGTETGVVFSRDYVKRINLGQETPQALAQGLKQAMAEIFTELEADLAGLKK